MANENDIYRELLDYLADGVYFTDTERRAAFWNKGAEMLSGFWREEVIGKRCLDNLLMHVDSAGKELCKNGCPLSETLRKKTAFSSDLSEPTNLESLRRPSGPP